MSRSSLRLSSPLCSCMLALGMFVLIGCHRDMRDQPRYETNEASDFFRNGQSARPALAGTVARGSLDGDAAFRTGKSSEGLVSKLPLTLDRKLLERGRERFTIFCTPCHSPVGDGNGMIVQRGFQRPPSYHSDRLRNVPIGHFFDVITDGFGAMPRFGPQIAARDRWAIAAYVRVLQLSQHAALSDVPATERMQLDQEAP